MGCFNHLLDEVSQILDIDCFWDEGSPETLRQEAERMCRSAAPPTPPEDFGYEIEVSNYPCATHGSEPDSVNQVYQMVRMGGNQQRIFRGTKDDRWWIYFDENCGGDHEPSWFLTPEAPDFEAKENLQNSDHGCTNTLKFSEIHFPSSVSISHFFCDANPEDLENEPRPSGWNNEFTQNGWEVHVDFRGAAPQPNCVDDDNYFQLMMTLMESDELSSCSDLINDDLRANVATTPSLSAWNSVKETTKSTTQALEKLLHTLKCGRTVATEACPWRVRLTAWKCPSASS